MLINYINYCLDNWLNKFSIIQFGKIEFKIPAPIVVGSGHVKGIKMDSGRVIGFMEIKWKIYESSRYVWWCIIGWCNS